MTAIMPPPRNTSIHIPYSLRPAHAFSVAVGRNFALLTVDGVLSSWLPAMGLCLTIYAAAKL
jgi:hypothetical protein